MPADLVLDLSATTSGLRECLDRIEQSGAGWNLPRAMVARLRIVVEELYANTIKHGYGGETGGPVCLRLRGEPAIELVYEDAACVGFLDHSPLAIGHVLLIPRAHVETFDELPDDLIAPLFRVVQRVSRSFARAVAAEGSYTAMNTRVSQSVPHVHVHVVPRRTGDGLFRAGLVWVRKRYADGEAAQLATRLREAIAAS